MLQIVSYGAADGCHLAPAMCQKADAEVCDKAKLFLRFSTPLTAWYSMLMFVISPKESLRMFFRLVIRRGFLLPFLTIGKNNVGF